MLITETVCDKFG